MTDYLSLEVCVPRNVYLLDSRNLRVGVFRNDAGFIGIREKFGSRFLFTEYHYDKGPPFGTVKPLKVLGVLPDDIQVRDSLGSACTTCGIEVGYDRTVPITKDEISYPGQWKHLRVTSCTQLRPATVPNTALFKYLDELESRLEDLP